jgi:hypothetical protein
VQRTPARFRSFPHLRCSGGYTALALANNNFPDVAAFLCSIGAQQ